MGQYAALALLFVINIGIYLLISRFLKQIIFSVLLSAAVSAGLYLIYHYFSAPNSFSWFAYLFSFVYSVMMSWFVAGLKRAFTR